MQPFRKQPRMSGIVETCQKVFVSFDIQEGIWILVFQKDYFGSWYKRSGLAFMVWFTSYRAIIIFGKCRMMKTITMAIMILASVKSMLWQDPFSLRELQMILMFRTMMARRGRKQVVVVGWNIFEYENIKLDINKEDWKPRMLSSHFSQVKINQDRKQL